MKTFNKLVRDRIPEIIEKNGDTAVFHVAETEEFKESLANKLVEEAQEFAESPSIEELADLLEVVQALLNVHEYSKDVLEATLLSKRDKRGGFEKRIILEQTS